MLVPKLLYRACFVLAIQTISTFGPLCAAQPPVTPGTVDNGQVFNNVTTQITVATTEYANDYGPNIAGNVTKVAIQAAVIAALPGVHLIAFKVSSYLAELAGRQVNSFTQSAIDQNRSQPTNKGGTVSKKSVGPGSAGSERDRSIPVHTTTVESPSSAPTPTSGDYYSSFSNFFSNFKFPNISSLSTEGFSTFAKQSIDDARNKLATEGVSYAPDIAASLAENLVFNSLGPHLPPSLASQIGQQTGYQVKKIVADSLNKDSAHQQYVNSIGQTQTQTQTQTHPNIPPPGTP